MVELFKILDILNFLTLKKFALHLGSMFGKMPKEANI
jgi:hypothetical protein